MPKSKSNAPSEASGHSVDTANSIPEFLARKATNTFEPRTSSYRNNSGIARNQSNVTASPKNSRQSKRHPGSGNSTDGGSTATDRSTGENNPGVGIGGWVSGIRVPSGNLGETIARTSSNNLASGAGSGTGGGGGGGGFGKTKSNMSGGNRSQPSSFSGAREALANAGGTSSSSNYPPVAGSGLSTSVRQGMQNPDPNSYELPPKQYVRYAGSASSASSDGDKYHFRNANPQFNLDYDHGDSGNPPSTAAGSPSHHGTSGDDTLDEETGGSSNSSSDDSWRTGSSASSLSSNARRTKQIAERPMLLYMVILIAVPILFLTIYQGLAVSNSTGALMFMNDHELPVEHMLELQESFQEEMVVVSSLIGYRLAYNVTGEEPLPSWVPQVVHDQAAEAEKYFKSTKAALDRLLRETSRGEGSVPEFYHKTLDLHEQLALAQIAADRNQGRKYREILLFTMSELALLLATLSENHFTVLFRMELVDIQLLVRVQEQWTNMYSMYLEIEHTYNKSLTYLNSNSEDARNEHRQECLDFSSGNSELEGFANFLIVGSGKPNVAAAIREFMNNGRNFLLEAYAPFLECDFQNATWKDDGETRASYLEQRQKIARVELDTFLTVVHNGDVQNEALVEGMKLLVSIVCCITGLIIVVMIQQRERSELLQIIDHSDKLTVAVRRFVPKNQLRMMGIRTVLQAEAGFSTEVAQSLIFNEVRNFAQLADQMSRIELFDWLQMYVARMTHVVQDQKGYVDAILGDSQFSVFPQATYAVGAGIMMQQETDHMNVDLVAQKHTDLVRIGVGVHCGIVVAGVFGDHTRLSCTMVASDVNLASRLQGLTKVYGCRIILSRAVMEQIDVDRFEIRRLATVTTAGSSNSLEIFDLFQADPEPVKLFKLETIKDFEKAVAYSASEKTEDRQKAAKIFGRLKMKAIEMNVHDPSLPIKIQEAQRESEGSSSRITKEIVEQAAMGGDLQFQ